MSFTHTNWPVITLEAERSLPFLPASYICNSIDNEIVHVFAGTNWSNTTKFTFHKSLFCSASRIFDMAFNNGEAPFRYDVRVLSHEMVDVCEEAGHFAIFMEWLYRNTLPSVSGLIRPQDQPTFTISFEKLLDLYVFAEKYEFNGFQNAIMDLIQDSWNTPPTAAILNTYLHIIFDKTSHFHQSTRLQNFCIADLHWSFRNYVFSFDDLAAFFHPHPTAAVIYFNFDNVYRQNHLDQEPFIRRPRNSLGFHLCFYHNHDPYEMRECPSNPTPN